MSDSRMESIEKLKTLVEGIDFCMLATLDGKFMRSRPMSTQEMTEDGSLWFFTSDQTHKVEQIEADSRVNVAYANPTNNTYVSVSGNAMLVHDQETIKSFWNPILKAWFPKGLDDPTLCLLKVGVEQAEYWDSSSSTFVQVFGFIKAVITGKAANAGENEKITL